MGDLQSSPALAGEGDRPASSAGWWRGRGPGETTAVAPPPLFAECSRSPSPAEAGEDFGSAATRLAGFAGAVLGWSPDTFWRATPAELAAVVAVLRGADDAVAPPDAATFQKLQEAFPDG